ncbi:MAG TPA: hypothetical protein VHF24_01920 [Acidimicrobiales bacterium]|nr:hypothetical protein [Acidimicrobiales bacterium]
MSRLTVLAGPTAAASAAAVAAVAAARHPGRALAAVWPDPRIRRLARLNLAGTIVVALLAATALADRLSEGAAAADADVPRVLPRSLPYGKGMWIWQPDKTERGDVGAIIARAEHVGLTHLYVRTGSSWDGFYAGPFLDRILPAAHAAGIRVYGWDFPRLLDPAADVARAVAAVDYRTPGGHHIDGFAPDIETAAEGTHITAESATAYGVGLRQALGRRLPLVAVVPRPSPARATFPYREVVAHFDAVAPMVYWLNREPGTDVAGAVADLRPLGKPIFPIGQAYDGAPEGGRRGVPPRAELHRFMEVAYDTGASGVSFWSWQAANAEAFDSIRDAPEFRVRVTGRGTFNRTGPLLRR